MCVESQDREIEDLCVSPIDFPAKWAAMIFGYFDESGEKGDGFVVVAGFVGRRKDWKNFLRTWRKELGDRESLHLAEMRLGSSKASRRYGDLLSRLGAVPSQVNLRAFVGSVQTAHHADRIKGTIAQMALAGYSVALVAMVDAILESKLLPKRERIEFAFEDQLEFAIPRAATFQRFRQGEKYQTHHGKSRIGKDSAMAKSTLLEASDYLAYAALQHLIDPDSQKARLTAPILAASSPIGYTEVSKENMDYLLNRVFPGEDIPIMNRKKKAFIIEEIEKVLRMGLSHAPPSWSE
jgi:hypothetical protein